MLIKYLLPLLAAACGALVLGLAARGARTLAGAVGRALLAVPAATAVGFTALALLTLLGVRLLGVGVREGTFPVRSRRGWQVWATERLLDAARTSLFPLYASLITPVWLRALGAKVGRGVEASTVLLLPKMTALHGPLFAASLAPHVARLRAGRRVDVVLGSFAYPDGVAAFLVARALGVPAVMKLHGGDMNVAAKQPAPARWLRYVMPRVAQGVHLFSFKTRRGYRGWTMLYDMLLDL